MSYKDDLDSNNLDTENVDTPDETGEVSNVDSGEDNNNSSSSFGSNAPKYDDGKVKYFGARKAFHLLSRVGDNEFLFMAATFDNRLLIGYSKQSQAMIYYNNPLYTKKLYLRKALGLYQQQLSEGLQMLFKAARHRIKSVTLTLDSDRSFMLFKVLLYQGKLKTNLMKLGFRLRWENGDDGEKLIIITRGGQGNNQEKK